jgi:hypothetical protein
MEESQKNLEQDELRQVTNLGKKHKILSCSVNGCVGFLNSEGRCRICSAVSCRQCLCLKEQNHICDDGHKKTIEYISNGTKGCPVCRIRISKIDGCDDMWCTNCKVPFSWKTGQRISSGPFENPHYSEQNDQSLPTLTEIGFTTYDNKCELQNNIVNVHTLLSKTIEELYKYESSEGNENLRKQYLSNKLSEQDFKMKIFTKEKHNEKNREIEKILNLFLNIGCMQFKNSIPSPTFKLRKVEIIELSKNLETLLKIARCLLENVENTYHCEVPLLYTLKFG